MKKIYTLFILALILTPTFYSCTDKWLDINEDPNKTTYMEPDLLFGYAVTSWSGLRCGGDQFICMGMMNQTISSGDSDGWATSFENYDIPEYSIYNAWKTYYIEVGNNLLQAIKIADELNYTNCAAQCKIAFAASFYEATMIWGDIPYSQAWSDIEDPVYDNQQSILINLIALLDDAISKIEIGKRPVITKNDPYFNGDLQHWIRWANSIKLKIAITMFDKEPDQGALITSLAETDLISEDVLFPYYNNVSNYNPKYRILYVNHALNNPWFFANSTMLDSLMKPVSDPRIPAYFSPGEKAFEGFDYYKGIPNATDADTIHAKLNVNTLLKSDSPDVLMSVQEVKYMLAEIYLRGIGVEEDITKANAYFHEGLTKALTFHSIDTVQIELFINQEIFDLTKSANPLKTLREQQYVDLQNRSLEAWIQVRRSGDKGKEIPLLRAPDTAGVINGEIARRWNYPAHEISNNLNAPQQKPGITEPLWFDK